jgi:hypothetical protein
MKILCDTMKRQIVSRAFYGWLAYCRHLKTIRLHLIGLVHLKTDEEDIHNEKFDGITTLTNEIWTKWLQDEMENGVSLKKYEQLIYEIIYINGCKNNELRAKVWPFLLKHYTFDMTPEQRFDKDVETKTNYSNLILEWKIFEDFIRLRDQQQRSIIIENYCASIPTPTTISSDNKTSTCIVQSKEKQILDKDLNLTPIISSSGNPKLAQIKNSNMLRNDLILLRKDSSLSNDVFIEDLCPSPHKEEPFNGIPEETLSQSQSKNTIDNESNRIHSRHSSTCSFMSFNDDEDTAVNNELDKSMLESVVVESPSVRVNEKSLDNKEILENFATNIHRIDKDVTRCDRNYYYFVTNENLQKLRNIMYT